MHDSLEHTLDHLAHLLPAQGPIGVFIHHNTLHAFQHLPFDQAVSEAAKLFGTEPYMSEEAYRAELGRGRIRVSDLNTVLSGEPDAPVPGLPVGRRELRRLILLSGLTPLDPATVEWHVREGGFLRSEDDRQRWAVCFDHVPEDAEPAVRPAGRPRDGYLHLTGVDLDEIVHPLLIRLCAVFLDQGMAYWPMPSREHGFYQTVRALLMQPLALYPQHLGELGGEFRRQAAEHCTAEQVVERILHRFAALEPRREAMLRSELLALAGWAGILRRLEQEPGLAPYVHLPVSLMDYLAVRLTFNWVAAESIARHAGLGPEWMEAWQVTVPDGPPPRQKRWMGAARLHEASAILGVTVSRLRGFDATTWAALRAELDAFDSIERRRLLHKAYELRHEQQILGPLGTFRAGWVRKADAVRPAAQVFCCIDEREESFRRHLEETDPEIETFGAAGFFGVAIDYAGIDDAHAVNLCPVVVTPQHAVREKVVAEDEELHGLRRLRRNLQARFLRGMFVSSRTLVRGWLSTSLLGVFSLFPLMARVLAPWRFARFREWMNASFLPEPRTELSLMRDSAAGHGRIEGLRLGFSAAESADRVAGVLSAAGLRGGFARLVVVLGHGSTSLNNPHESAHDCGACGGRRGGPNARLFAAMANDPSARAELASRGIAIPADTWFVGGYHDTCSDTVDLFDTALVPEALAPDLQRVRASLDRARALDAHERARRFEFAYPQRSADEALRHVEERSEHLAEPRPEYGHCTNAVCIVGRRAITRGLFFDRRAFLVSYDATQDPTDEALGRVLGAVVPVCGGISLEYYFSFVDNEKYGCGTKLPHNVTGLVGVMNGQASDLRTGLPWQMVEIHEPVRLLMIVESTPERVWKTFQANAGILEFVVNHWVRLAVIDPDTGAIAVYRDGRFEPFTPSGEPLPVSAGSVKYYQGRMEHLPVARVDALEKAGRR